MAVLVKLVAVMLVRERRARGERATLSAKRQMICGMRDHLQRESPFSTHSLLTNYLEDTFRLLRQLNTVHE